MFWQKSAIFALALALSACLQTENSSTLDADYYGNSSGTPEFMAARVVFQQSCAGGSCHSFHTWTEARFKTEPPIRLIAGDPDNSPIYNRLFGSSGTNLNKDMPVGSALSSSDLATIRTWVENVTP